MELQWRIRVLKNADAEDRAYHNITPEGILDWCDERLRELEEHDKQFAQTKGKLYLGKL
jgi:hypothetical protein